MAVNALFKNVNNQAQRLRQLHFCLFQYLTGENTGEGVSLTSTPTAHEL